MKKVFLCLIVLALTSCIDVQDFGAYWGKGYVDKDVIGNWDISDASKITGKKREPKIVRVNESAGVYHVQYIENGRIQSDPDPQVGKTLKAGKYKYLLFGSASGTKEGKGKLFRYAVRGNVLLMYELKPDAMAMLLHEKYPSVKNIRKTDCTDRKFCALPIEILKLDDAVFKFLSEIPDTPEFWSDPSPIPRSLR